MSFIKNKQVKDLFNWYSGKKINEYEVSVNGTPVTAHQFITKKGSHNGQPIDKRTINKFNPDRIDSNLFWSEAINIFNLFPIGGGECANIDELNKLSIKMSKALHALPIIINNIDVTKDQNLRILEIGPGYGGVYNLISEVNLLKPTYDYYAIDVNPLFKSHKLFKTDGKTIPVEVPETLDIVYSINVFQHLSPAQRKSYYKQIYDRLIPGGEFIFSMYVETERNKDFKVWGYKDKDGRNYVHFFNQFTAVDTMDELKATIKEIGFSDIVQLIDDEHTQNYFSFKLIK